MFSSGLLPQDKSEYVWSSQTVHANPPANQKGFLTRSFHQAGRLEVVSFITSRREVFGFVPVSVYEDTTTSLLLWHAVAGSAEVQNL